MGTPVIPIQLWVLGRRAILVLSPVAVLQRENKEGDRYTKANQRQEQHHGTAQRRYMESVDQILYFIITLKSLKSKDNTFGDGIKKTNDKTTNNPPFTATYVMQATCLNRQ